MCVRARVLFKNLRLHRQSSHGNCARVSKTSVAREANVRTSSDRQNDRHKTFISASGHLLLATRTLHLIRPHLIACLGDVPISRVLMRGWVGSQSKLYRVFSICFPLGLLSTSYCKAPMADRVSLNFSMQES